MAADLVDLSSERDGLRLKVATANSRYLLLAGDPEQFPAVTVTEEALPALSLPRSAFFGLLARVAPAQGLNDEQPILNGTQLRLHSADGQSFLKATAYNRRVCITDQIPIPGPTTVPDFTVVIPAAAVQELIRLAGPADASPLELSLTSGGLRLSFPGPGATPEARLRLRYDTCLLSDGVFPDTSKALQIATAQRASLPPSALPEAVNRVALATSLNPQYRLIRTVFDEKGLSLSAQSEGFGEAREKIVALTPPTAGEEERRAAFLNPALVSQILRPIADRELHVSLQGPQGLLHISTDGFYRSAVAPMVMPAASATEH